MSGDTGGYNQYGGRVFGGPHIAGPEAPIFDYLNLVQRHYNGRRLQRPGERLGQTLPEASPRTVPGRDWRRVNLTGLCWSGYCEGCGRTLISATWQPDSGHERRRRKVYCTRACRAAHTGAPAA